MKCPACDTIINKVSTSSHYGIPIVLDQCPGCGGVWFDDSEIYHTKNGEARKIEEKINVRNLRKFSDFRKELFCPRDGEKLKPLSKNYMFSNLEMDVCPKCDGIWLNYGVFSKYQYERTKNQEKTNSRKKALDESIDEKEISSKIEKQAIALMQLDAMLSKKRKQDNKRWIVETIILILLKILFKK